MQDTVWICKDGRQVPVRQMADSHLANAIALICRSGWRIEYLDRLQLEQQIRTIERSGQ